MARLRALPCPAALSSSFFVQWGMPGVYLLELTLSWVISCRIKLHKCAIAQLFRCPSQGLRTLAAVPREQSFSLLKVLLSLPGSVALPRLGQTHEELGRVRLLGGVDMSLELLTEAARVGFHPAHYRPTARAATSLPRSH